MRSTLIFFKHLLRTSIKASMSKRGAFLFECALMIANNLIFLSMWWIFFRQFNHVAGWDFRDMVVLMAVVSGGYGLTQICFGGVRNLSHMIPSGDLDPFMTQPKNLLLHVAGSKSFTKGWGNLMTALALFILGGIYSPYEIFFTLLGILSSCLIFTSFSVIMQSLPFWMGSVEGLSKKYCDALYLFAIYPTNIYSGVLQVVMFTAIPAGVISYFPVELVRAFSWTHFVLLLGSSLGFFALAFWVFYSGLKRYESGNKFGTRL